MEEVKKVFEKFIHKRYISVSVKDEVKQMQEIQSLNERQKKKITELLKIIKTGYITKDDKDKYRKIFDELIELSKETTRTIVQAEPSEINSQLVQVTNIEKKLDSAIGKYNGFSKRKPMDYVNYDMNRSRYEILVDGTKKRSKNSEDICKMALEIIRGKVRQDVPQISPKISLTFEYKKCNFVTYKYGDRLLFDIQHIMQVISNDKRTTERKYASFSKYITNYIVVKNEFGGYFIRELIPEETMYELILSSNSDFSKSFKKEVSQILVKLRQSGQLVLTEDKMQVVEYDRHNAQDETVNANLQLIQLGQVSPSTYDNPEYELYVRKLISKGCDISLMTYNKQPTMYFVILALNDLTGKNRIFCKVGYTDNIAQRFKQLSEEYKCNVFLVALKGVKNKKKEAEFHEMMHNNCKYITYDMKINGKKKDEIYIFTRSIYHSFMKIKEHIDPDSEDARYDEECQEIIKNQYQIFTKHIEYLKYKAFMQHLLEKPDITPTQENLMIKYMEMQVRLAEIELEKAKYK